MPQASAESHALMERYFGDATDDQMPIAFLRSRGYTLTDNWQWKKPVPSHTVREEEWDCIVFLATEWDFGGVVG